MKKIISIAFAAILAGLAISCQKEEAVSDKTDAVQYTFNITVNDRSGFDNGASTKGDATYKSAWENGDKIFLFFKPTEGSLLGDRYATLTYKESSWVGTVTQGKSSLGNGGTLSAVYVYKLDGSVTPAYSDSKWTIPTGNTFYNCQAGVTYTVSGDVISATLNLIAPDSFVQFYVTSATGALTCDKVKGWKDIAIGSDMAVRNVTCTGYMDGFTNSGDSNVKEYYGRIVDGTSLNGKACEFSVVNNGKVYERPATPESDARSFKMNTSDGNWQEAVGKLPGLFTVGKSADGIAGTADDVQVRFSQGNLVATIGANGAPTAWKFATNQYDHLGTGGANKTIGKKEGDVDLFGWSTSNNGGTSTTDNYGIKTSEKRNDYPGEFYDWGKAYCISKSITPDNTWRTLTSAEWQYLFAWNSALNDGKGSFDEKLPRYGLHKNNVTVCSKGYCVVIAPDNWDLKEHPLQTSYGKEPSKECPMTWEEAEAAGLVCLPATGDRSGSYVDTPDSQGYYWSSTAGGSVTEYAEYMAYFIGFDARDVYPGNNSFRYNGHSVRLVTE